MRGSDERTGSLFSSASHEVTRGPGRPSYHTVAVLAPRHVLSDHEINAG